MLVPDLFEQRTRRHRADTSPAATAGTRTAGRRQHAIERAEVRLDAGDDDVGVGAVPAPRRRLDGVTLRIERARALSRGRIGADAHGHFGERVDPFGHRAHAVVDERSTRGAPARRWRDRRRRRGRCRRRRRRATLPSGPRSRTDAVASDSVPQPTCRSSRRHRSSRSGRSAPTSASSSASVTTLRRSAVRLKRANASSRRASSST